MDIQKIIESLKKRRDEYIEKAISCENKMRDANLKPRVRAEIEKEYNMWVGYVAALSFAVNELEAVAE